MIAVVIAVAFFGFAIGGIISLIQDPKAWLQSDVFQSMSSNEKKNWFKERAYRHAWWIIGALICIFFVNDSRL